MHVPINKSQIVFFLLCCQNTFLISSFDLVKHRWLVPFDEEHIDLCDTQTCKTLLWGTSLIFSPDKQPLIMTEFPAPATSTCSSLPSSMNVMIMKETQSTLKFLSAVRVRYAETKSCNNYQTFPLKLFWVLRCHRGRRKERTDKKYTIILKASVLYMKGRHFWGLQRASHG